MSAAQALGSSVPYLYLLSAVMFIFGLKRLSKVRTARSGNTIAAAAMALAVVGTLLELNFVTEQAQPLDYRWIVGGVVIGGGIGAVAAMRVAMTSMPEMVALFNGFGGGASGLVAAAVVWQELVAKDVSGAASLHLGGGSADAVTISISVIIGALTMSGSLIALLKLQGKIKNGAPVLLPGRHAINIGLGLALLGLSIWFGWFTTGGAQHAQAVIGLTLVSLLLGVLLVIPIGGADMPVVVSLLNSYSGLAACAAGFVIGNTVLIIAGSMVGAAGLILTQIMCVAMNRSLLNVLVGGFGVEDGGGSNEDARNYTRVTSCGAEEAAMVLETAERVVFVPGYGLAVAQAQHAVRELAEILEKRGVKVTYAIHPVAGRMPGHMNVLLAEANVEYDKLLTMEEANPEFNNTDVTIIIGANDVVNPAAASDKTSPIYGMPILETHHSQTVFVIKRSLSPGYAGVKNELFEYDNTMMVFGDAKKVVNGLITELKSL